MNQKTHKNPELMLRLLRNNRSYRRFGGDYLSEEQLRELVACCTFVPSGGNLQRLRFRLVSGKAACDAVFPTLGWAGYLSDWDGPCEEERPRGYLVLLCHPTENNQLLAVDTGICAQSILLAATECGLGGCMIKNVKPELLDILHLSPELWQIALVIALGEPRETVRLVPLSPDGSIRYYRDENDVHCVPKRSVDDLMV